MQVRIYLSIICSSLFLLHPAKIIAQVVSDQTLPQSTKVTNSDGIISITQGTKSGKNLFHSFKELNASQDEVLRFIPTSNTNNIFSRVTGRLPSSLDGRISVVGSANLYILNSNGIIFGPNARLDLAGSFLASTASEVEFSDAGLFRIRDSQVSNSLSSANPVSLKFNFPGSIVINGTGHTLAFSDPSNPVTSPTSGLGQGFTGLATAVDRTIALIGGTIDFNGGVVTSNNIQLASVLDGPVLINQNSGRLSFDFRDVHEYGDISLDDFSLIDISGFRDGELSINARDLSLSDASIIASGNFGVGRNSSINIDLTDSLYISNINDISTALFAGTERVITNNLSSINFGSGKGSDINIQAKNVLLDRFASITSSNFGAGKGGDINISVDDQIIVNSESVFPEIFMTGFTFSFINSVSFAGSPGTISLSGRRLELINGSTILNQASGRENGTEISASFRDEVVISGGILLDPTTNSFLPSNFGSTTTSNANAGLVSIKTRDLKLRDGGVVTAAASSIGDGGLIRLQIENNLEISGKIPGSLEDDFFTRSGIFSTASTVNPVLASFLDIPENLVGDTGSITVSAKNVSLSNRGSISVLNGGSGDGGAININAEKLFIRNNADITASAASGNGGNIFLSPSILSLFDKSSITASALGEGSGGNIGINSNLILLADSSIIANAEFGTGGQITVFAEGLFTDDVNNISAASDFGNDGEVIIDSIQNSVETDETDIPDLQATKIALTCDGKKGVGSSFFVLGKGGLPIRANSSLNGAYVPPETPLARARAMSSDVQTVTDSQGQRMRLIEPSGFIRHGDGTVGFAVEVENANGGIDYLVSSRCLAESQNS